MRSRTGAYVATALTVLVSLLLVSPAVSGEGPRQGRFVIGASDDTTTPFNLVSVPALIEHTYDGHGLRLVHMIKRNRVAEKWRISYVGDGLPLGGTLLLPRSRGPHPVVVSMHGYLPPSMYRNGMGLVREEWRMAEQGYVVLHPDYRNFGASQVRSEPAEAGTSPLGYPADVLNAVVALERADLERVDTSRMSLFGRSMGGGVALQVAEARPEWFRSLLVYSPVSSDAADNYERWVRHDESLRRRVDAAYGSPESDPSFWHDASSVNFVDRLTGMPVQIHHGTGDPICPEIWSEKTYQAIRDAGVSVAIGRYKGQPHRFTTQWPLFMDRADRFLRRTLG